VHLLLQLDRLGSRRKPAEFKSVLPKLFLLFPRLAIAKHRASLNLVLAAMAVIVQLTGDRAHGGNNCHAKLSFVNIPRQVCDSMQRASLCSCFLFSPLGKLSNIVSIDLRSGFG
jgi:hypothetical protein